MLLEMEGLEILHFVDWWKQMQQLYYIKKMKSVKFRLFSKCMCVSLSYAVPAVGNKSLEKSRMLWESQNLFYSAIASTSEI